jgi:hypothetical protein
MAGDDGREIAERRRRERLAAALRENLKRRNAQRRGRAAIGKSTPPGGSPASPREEPGR